jgi:hypothetical protein
MEGELRLNGAHPFLSCQDHRSLVDILVKKFIKRNLNLDIEQSKIGHLFFGQRAFPLEGRDIGFVYANNAKYYPLNEDSSISNGLILLIDEVGIGFDIGIGEVSSDNIGSFFENVIINIRIPKKESVDISCLDSDEFYFEVYSIDNNGTLIKLASSDIDRLKLMCSNKIMNIILFNIDKI